MDGLLLPYSKTTVDTIQTGRPIVAIYPPGLAVHFVLALTGKTLFRGYLLDKQMKWTSYWHNPYLNFATHL